MVTRPFRVSAGLKDLIGQGLITNDYVAVFELVKNSFDAHARSVQVVFLQDKIIIADDGKGMSHDDITAKWLFVAYSAKRDVTEYLDYR
ncbi:MAG: ATP-binding protein, partial [Gammaproteobacteria bacterium]|nr:ATP-binding protein [Gammaproteobacteria bacterium]